MVDAFELLQSQAAQTTNVFAAINQNTTRAFEAKRAALTAQMNTAINISQQAEQSRMNDMQLMQAQQEMKYKALEMGMREKEFAANQKLVPLKLQYEESRMKAGLLENTVRQVDPFIQDLKTETSQAIFESPELADDAMKNLAEISTSIASELLTNPNMDVQQAIAIRKQQYSKWLTDSKTLTTEQKRQSVVFGAQKKEIDLGKAKSLYASLGGNPAEFDKKHNPEYRSALDTAKRVMKLTGKLDSDVLSKLDESDRLDVIKSVESRQNFELLRERSLELSKQLKDMRSEESPNPELIQALEEEISFVRKSMQGEMQNFGTAPAGQGGQAQSSILDRIKDEVVASQQRMDTRPESMSGFAFNIEEKALQKVKALPLPEKVAKHIDSRKGIYATSFDVSDFSENDIEKLAQNDAFLNVVQQATGIALADKMQSVGSPSNYGGYVAGGMTEKLLEGYPTSQEIADYKLDKLDKREEKIFLKKLAKVIPTALELYARQPSE